MASRADDVAGPSAVQSTPDIGTYPVRQQCAHVEGVEVRKHVDETGVSLLGWKGNGSTACIDQHKFGLPILRAVGDVGQRLEASANEVA